MLMRMFTSHTKTMHVGLSEWPGLEARAVFTSTTGQASTNTTIPTPLRLRQDENGSYSTLNYLLFIFDV